MDLKECFINSKNIGKIKKCTNFGKHKSGFCGDTIEVYLIVKDNIVKDCKYQACGCWALIGSASYFSEYIKNKNIDEILNLSDDEYLKLLGNIPEEKINCVLVTKQAFINALEQNI